MTENKRFHYQGDGYGYYYICDGGRTEDKIFAEVSGDVEDITDKLNELNEENEQLKHSIKCLEADKMELQQYIKRIQGDVE